MLGVAHMLGNCIIEVKLYILYDTRYIYTKGSMLLGHIVSIQYLRIIGYRGVLHKIVCIELYIDM